MVKIGIIHLSPKKLSVTILTSLLQKIHNTRFNYLLKKAEYNYQKEITRLQKERQIKVAFFALYSSIWKYDNLYNLFDQSKRYIPFVVVCPHYQLEQKLMLEMMQESYNYFESEGYRVITTFSANTNTWIDIKNNLNPDIVFFTTPYTHSRPEYNIKNYLDRLTCYVPYTFQTNFKYNLHYDSFFHNIIWKIFLPTLIHEKLAKDNARNNAKNAIVTGYPGIDGFLLNSYKSARRSSSPKKYIIWAPHHTIEEQDNDLGFSNFNRYSDFFIHLTNYYREKVFITFKPHPLLKGKLYNSENWGRQRTDDYYNYWKNNNFCDLNDGNYQELFIASDALIHDCDSFLAEYIALNKPSLYTQKDEKVTERMNEFGLLALRAHYSARTKEEIINFIEHIVLGGEDSKRKERTAFINQHLVPQYGQTASNNIYDIIDEQLTFRAQADA